MKREREKPVISVIVPVYNVRPYLARCLDSIGAQTWANLEAILVDDGSTDGSGQVCDSYAARDGRFRAVHFPVNRGLSAARNEGVIRAKGAFLSFVDSDDYVEPDLLEKLYESLVKNGADMSVCRAEGIGTGNVPATVYSRTETVLCLARREPFLWTAWGKLYPAGLVKSHPFEAYAVCCEDLLFFYRILNGIKRISYTPDGLYHYIYREGSLINSPIDEKRCVVLSVLDDICRDAVIRFPEAVPGLAQVAMEISTRLAMEAVEAGTAGEGLFLYLRRFQKSVRRHFSWKALLCCGNIKSMLAELALYTDAAFFWILALLFKGMKSRKRQGRRRDRGIEHNGQD